MYRFERRAFLVVRLAATLALLCLMSVAVSAFTVVMRGGHSIQIPDNFSVTPTTLTYEAAPGINVTLQMSNIDIEATERINEEPAGSLLRRAGAHQRPDSHANAAAIASPQTSRARRTITNRDLEATRRAREKSEEAYERRRAELGLPSLEDARRRSEEEARRLNEMMRQSEEEKARSESYWRARAGELRAEIAAVDAQIGYLRNHLGQQPRPFTTGSYTVLTSIVPRFHFGRRGFTPVFYPPRHPFGGVGARARATTVIGSGGGHARGQVIANSAESVAHNAGRHGTYAPWGVIAHPYGLYASASVPAYDASYEQTMLWTRLRELESVRSGLDARWRLLEDEARRAGAMPGWLRP